MLKEQLRGRRIWSHRIAVCFDLRYPTHGSRVKFTRVVISHWLDVCLGSQRSEKGGSQSPKADACFPLVKLDTQTRFVQRKKKKATLRRHVWTPVIQLRLTLATFQSEIQRSLFQPRAGFKGSLWSPNNILDTMGSWGSEYAISAPFSELAPSKTPTSAFYR